MTASTFDTLAAARDLEAAGFERRQAEALASAIRSGQGDLATKTDLEAGLATLESRLVRWGAGLAVAVVIILGVLIRWP